MCVLLLPNKLVTYQYNKVKTNRKREFKPKDEWLALPK